MVAGNVCQCSKLIGGERGADLLAAFGINLDMNADKSRAALDELGVCFLFAPAEGLVVVVLRHMTVYVDPAQQGKDQREGG